MLTRPGSPEAPPEVHSTTEPIAPPLRSLSRGRLLAYSFLTTLLLLALLEGVSRGFTPSDCSTQARLQAYAQERGRELLLKGELNRGSVPMVADPKLIWSLPPWYRGYNCETWVRHNALGLRAPDYPLEKPPHTVRIVLLGDSTIYGFGVDTENMLATRLQVWLQSGFPDQTIQVINGGVPGYSSLQSLALLRRVLAGYQPDVVVVANMWSDFISDDFEDKVVLFGQGWRASLRQAAQRVDDVLSPHSALYCGIKGQLERPLEEDTFFNRVRQPSTQHRPGYHRVGPTDYRANLSALGQTARGLKALPVYTMLVNPMDLWNEPVDMHGAYRQIMLEVAAQEQAPLVDLRPIFLSAAEEGIGPLFMDEIHPTAIGHELMARALAKGLAEDPAVKARLAGGP